MNLFSIKYFFRQIFVVPLVIFTAFFCLVLSKKRETLIWGPTPIISNKYWSQAMREAGWNSKTLMTQYYSINKKEDFDLYFEDTVPKWIPSWLATYLKPCFAMLYIIRYGKVVHLSFHGGPFGQTPLWELEAYLFRWAGVKTIVIPYGADAYMYSQVIDTSLKHALLLSYPEAAKHESKISKRVSYWTRYADVIIAGLMVDGMGRWNIPMPSPFCLDSSQWQPKKDYTSHNGSNGSVKVIHTPNHRGFKGTEFLIQAVKELQAEGLQVELTLLERVPNDKVRELMLEMDILAEQFVATGYALSGIEGMASGLPVLANLEHEAYTRIFRRYSFLNECPILSTTPETIKQNLKILITNPKLRQELGLAGRQYVEKYHSYKATQFVFGSIYAKILEGKEVDLMNLFHPLRSEYSHSQPMINHPLIENRLPPQYLKQNYAEVKPVPTFQEYSV